MHLAGAAVQCIISRAGQAPVCRARLSSNVRPQKLHRHALLLLISATLGAVPCIAQEAKSLPFTQAQNQDGSRFVWFIFGNAGFRYDYVPAGEIPKAKNFRPVDKPKSGDVAVWPDFVAVAAVGSEGQVSFITADGELEQGSIEKRRGKPKFFRFSK